MPASNATLRYVRRVAFDVLRRPPRAAEARASVGMPVDRVAKLFVYRGEAMQEWVEEELFYYLLIDRFRPRTPAIDALPARLRSRDATVRDAAAEFLLSTGFSLRNPGNDTFVTVVLEQVLGMEVQDRRNRATLEAGKRIFDGEPARFLGRRGSSQADIVRIAIEHEDSARHLLDRHRRRLFGTGLDALPADQAAAVVARIHAEPGEFFDVIGEWLASEAYLANLEVRKPKTDRQFVRSLYVDLLDRTPTYDELRNVRNALQSMADSSPLRAVMVQLALASEDAVIPASEPGDAAGFVTACFERYLGRSPRQGELAGFAAILEEPDTTPRHVVRALLTSTEYGYC